MSVVGEAPIVLDVQHVSKTYRRDGGLLALDDVSMHVAEGECVGLIGPSGSGKSTLANVIARLLEPDSGRISFNGASVDGRAGRPSRGERDRVRRAWLAMQMVFQNPAASFSQGMRLGEAVFEGVRYLPGGSGLDKDALIREAFGAVGLPSSYADKYAFELSGGECQRAAIARAIIGKPKLIICDEPTSSLDVTVQADVMRLLGGIREELGTSFLFISHNIALVNEFCSRIYRIEGGRITGQLEACDQAHPR